MYMFDRRYPFSPNPNPPKPQNPKTPSCLLLIIINCSLYFVSNGKGTWKLRLRGDLRPTRWSGTKNVAMWPEAHHLWRLSRWQVETCRTIPAWWLVSGEYFQNLWSSENWPVFILPSAVKREHLRRTLSLCSDTTTQLRIRLTKLVSQPIIRFAYQLFWIWCI